MTTAIVFSRDRACQLDALLGSLHRNLSESPLPPAIRVLWTATTPEYEAGYAICRAKNTFAHFVREHEFQDDLEHMLPFDGLVVFFTDDDILFRRVSLDDAYDELERRDDVLAFSLRLGLNTTHCYPHDSAQGFPSSEAEPAAEDKTMRWLWRDASLDFGYPMSLDGHVFRVEDIWNVITGLTYRNPNELEDQLAHLAAHTPASRPLLASYAESALVGIPVNRVNETHPNRHAAALDYPVSWLNERYLAGERIDVNAMDFTDVKGAHQELALVLA